MKSSHNKFKHNSNSKLGNEIRSATNLTNIMKAGISTAIPIYEMLGLTEEEYIKIYHKNVVVDSSNNDVVDSSNNDISKKSN